MNTKRIVFIQIAFAVIALVVIAWVFFVERPQAVVNQQLKTQLTQVQQQNQVIETEIKETVPSDPKKARTYVRAGRDLFHQGKFDESIVQYEKATELNPYDPYAWSLKGYALFRAGRIADSIEANNKAVELDPGDPLDYINLAKSYCAAKRYDDAKRALIQAPPSGTASEVQGYLKIDGEIRRVCKPILKDVTNAS